MAIRRTHCKHICLKKYIYCRTLTIVHTVDESMVFVKKPLFNSLVRVGLYFNVSEPHYAPACH